MPIIQHILPLLVNFTAKRGHFRGDGEKLGFGLRFEGGGRATECVRRLFIQVNKPASFLFFVLYAQPSNSESHSEVITIKTRLTYNRAHLRLTKESLTFEYDI